MNVRTECVNGKVVEVSEQGNGTWMVTIDGVIKHHFIQYKGEAIMKAQAWVRENGGAAKLLSTVKNDAGVETVFKAKCYSGKVVTVDVNKQGVCFVEIDGVGVLNGIFTEKQMAYERACSEVLRQGGEIEWQSGLATVDFNALYPSTMTDNVGKRTVSGYIPDRELYEWALFGLTERLNEVKEVQGVINPFSPQAKVWATARHVLQQKITYLQEILDGLG